MDYDAGLPFNTVNYESLGPAIKVIGPAIKVIGQYDPGMKIHTKSRNRLEQKRLNDLVYIKYNRALKGRYDARDTINPIALDDIDESNEWLLGRSNLSEEDDDEENAHMYEDDDLTWGDVARASGVDEDACLCVSSLSFKRIENYYVKCLFIKGNQKSIYFLEIHHKVSLSY
ncbi:UNVERIFIED_CONTAM: hypothetical protein Sradi_5234200 [Sesamum radiatum]|uniref:Uncharacterized protein n=1 Tax=Sesamum radiatum TaxID=300843 RepID=A0AAW2LKH0_SESRA